MFCGCCFFFFFVVLVFYYIYIDFCSLFVFDFDLFGLFFICFIFVKRKIHWHLQEVVPNTMIWHVVLNHPNVNVVHLSSRPEMHTNEQTRTISGGVRVEVERERERAHKQSERNKTNRNKSNTKWKSLYYAHEPRVEN